MEHLIVGTGRSGTQALARHYGAGHQTIRHAHVLGEPLPPLPEVEVSFEAVPIMGRFDCHKTLVVRHPAQVVMSWVHRGVFGDDMRSEYALWSAVLDRHFPHVLTETTPADRAARYWLEWNGYAATYADEVRRLDDMGIEVVDATDPPIVGFRSLLARECYRWWRSV